MVKLASFLFGRPKPWAEYAFVALRLAIAGLWLNAVIPRWNTVAAGKVLSNNLVRMLFRESNVPSLTLFFTILETLGAIALILGLLTRLAAVWGIIEFGIIWINGVIGGTFRADLVFLAVSIVLLLYGSFLLSVDGLIAKKKF
jgi:uncharacterized membrane protein YphA (DoxX/SURF4 family)